LWSNAVFDWVLVMLHMGKTPDLSLWWETCDCDWHFSLCFSVP